MNIILFFLIFNKNNLEIYGFFNLFNKKTDLYILNTKKNLKELDNRLNELNKEIKTIKNIKNNMLRYTKGYKPSNFTKEIFNKYVKNDKNYYDDEDDDDDEYYDDDDDSLYPLPNKDDKNKFYSPEIRIIYQQQQPTLPKNTETEKSENFQIYKNHSITFKDVGGYTKIKEELLQCADLLVNYNKYAKYNVRTPKGLILEGPPGNGKTLLAKAFSGEINIGFIPVSGSQFQEKYVGVGASRIRELFELALNNKPCIIFIDEIDAVGRKRLGDGESSSSERDSTLNELLVNLDGFKSTNGIFIMGATNRVDLLDSALIRPGRIDKQIYVNNPDKKTREAIINIHIEGKPYDKKISIDQLIEMTNGFSGAQIENLLNEAMLNALRNDRELITMEDLELIVNRILVGWQSTENKLSQELLYQVAVHEIGHALLGIFLNYKKLIKVTINLWSPKNLGFTLFESSEDEEVLITKEKLITEITVLLGGRIAEELFFYNKISTGATQDLDICKSISTLMITKYGMGSKNIFTDYSDKNKEIIDNEMNEIIDESYNNAKNILLNCKNLIEDCAKELVINHILTLDFIENIIIKKYKYIYNYIKKIN